VKVVLFGATGMIEAAAHGSGKRIHENPDINALGDQRYRGHGGNGNGGYGGNGSTQRNGATEKEQRRKILLCCSSLFLRCSV
jgi:hypothetical protein